MFDLNLMRVCFRRFEEKSTIIEMEAFARRRFFDPIKKHEK